MRTHIGEVIIRCFISCPDVRLGDCSIVGSSQPASLGLSHSKSHSHPIQSAPGSKIPVYVRQTYPEETRRSRSSSPPPADKPVLEQRSPEEDSSLFNISNISTASSGSCSNSSYSLSGSTPAPLLSGNDGSGSVIMVETASDNKPGYCSLLRKHNYFSFAGLKVVFYFFF